MYCGFLVKHNSILTLLLELLINEVQCDGLVLGVKTEHSEHEVQVKVGPVLKLHVALEHLVITSGERALAQAALDEMWS